MDRKTN